MRRCLQSAPQHCLRRQLLLPPCRRAWNQLRPQRLWSGPPGLAAPQRGHCCCVGCSPASPCLWLEAMQAPCHAMQVCSQAGLAKPAAPHAAMTPLPGVFMAAGQVQGRIKHVQVAAHTQVATLESPAVLTPVPSSRHLLLQQPLHRAGRWCSGCCSCARNLRLPGLPADPWQRRAAPAATTDAAIRYQVWGWRAALPTLLGRWPKNAGHAESFPGSTDAAHAATT